VVEPLTSGPHARADLPVRRRLLLATSRLVYRHGIAATGVESILDAAGAARMSLYRHFPGGKDQLVAAALADRSERTVEHVLGAARAVARDAGPVATVLAVFDVVDTASRQPGYRGCPFLNAAAELPPEHPGRAVVLDHKRQMRARLADLLREAGAADGAVDRLAGTVLLLLDGALAAAGLTPQERPARLARAVAADLLDRELTAPRAAARAAGSRG
jgi:AcrR family transcriptional regulator